MRDESQQRFQFNLVNFFALLATLGIAPFVVMRYMHGQLPHALVDLAIVIVALGNAFIARHCGRVSPLNLSITAALYTLGAVAVAYLNNPLFVFWVFPALLANVFLLSARLALAVNLLAVAGLLRLALSLPDPVDGMAMIASLIFATCLAFIFAQQNERQRRQLEESATLDPLTRLANRRLLNHSVAECIHDFEREATPATLIIFDLDYFKQINDEFGHSVGDELLQRLGEILTLRIRKTDRAFRFGGEEFVVLARNTKLADARRLAEQLRVNISLELNAPEGEMTASFGCAQLHPGDTPDSWFNRADKAVYQAKDQGRNCVVCAE